MQIIEPISLGSRKIYKTKFEEPYLIAEIGVNYYDVAKKEGLELVEAAKLMIDAAKDARCDAVKFQTYKAEQLASKYATAFWDRSLIKESNQIELYRKYDKLSMDEYRELIKYSQTKGVKFVTTVFSEDFVDIFDSYLSYYKVASADLTNYVLVKKIAKMKKPILLSTGASNMEEIVRAIRWIEEEGNSQIIPLHCVLSYPTSTENAYLGYIKHLDLSLPYPVGYSCHVVPEKGMPHLIWAWLLGAKVIEKHFTIDKTLPGNDHYHAFDVEDGKIFRETVKKIIKMYGTDLNRYLIPAEGIARKNARRSLFAKKTLNAGDVISLKNITAKRPAGVGINSEFAELIIGTKAKKKIEKDEPLKFEYIDNY